MNVFASLVSSFAACSISSAALALLFQCHSIMFLSCKSFVTKCNFSAPGACPGACQKINIFNQHRCYQIPSLKTTSWATFRALKRDSTLKTDLQADSKNPYCADLASDLSKPRILRQSTKTCQGDRFQIRNSHCATQNHKQ